MRWHLWLRCSPSDSSFRYFFHQVNVPALCAPIRDWTIAQILGDAVDLDQLVFHSKILRRAIEHIAAGGSAFIAQLPLCSVAPGVAFSQAYRQPATTMSWWC